MVSTATKTPATIATTITTTTTTTQSYTITITTTNTSTTTNTTTTHRIGATVTLGITMRAGVDAVLVNVWQSRARGHASTASQSEVSTAQTLGVSRPPAAIAGTLSRTHRIVLH